MSDSRFGLSREVMAKILAVFESYQHIERLVLYGSRAMGTQRPGSDIDLTIVAPTLTMTELLRIENELDELLLPYKFDLSLFHLIDNDSLREHISRVGIDFKM